MGVYRLWKCMWWKTGLLGEVRCRILRELLGLEYFFVVCMFRWLTICFELDLLSVRIFSKGFESAER